MKLDRYLDEHNLTDTAFAALIDVSSESVRRYRNETRIPDKEVMVRIVKATEGAVQPNDFYPAITPEAA